MKKKSSKHKVKNLGNKLEAMCRVMREAWVQIPALPLQAIGSQAVNIACLGLSVPTCKVEMKTEAALKIVLHGRDEQVPHREGPRTATEELFWLASISLHNAANRQGRGVLYLACSLCKLCAQWLWGSQSHCLLSFFGSVGLRARNVMAVRILTMTSPDNVSGNSVSIKWFKVDEMEQRSLSLIVWCLPCSSHGLDSYSDTLLVPN